MHEEHDWSSESEIEYGELYNIIKEQNLEKFKKKFDDIGLDEIYSFNLSLSDLFYNKNTDTDISIRMIEYVDKKKNEDIIQYIANSRKIIEFIDCDCVNLFSFFLSKSKYYNKNEYLFNFLNYSSRETAYNCMNFILSKLSNSDIKENQDKIINSLDTILYYLWDRIYYGNKDNIEGKKIYIEKYDKAINIIIKYLEKNTLNEFLKKLILEKVNLDDYNIQITEFKINKIRDINKINPLLY